MQKESEWGDQIVLATSGQFENATAIFMHLCSRRAPTASQSEKFAEQKPYLDELCIKARK